MYITFEGIDGSGKSLQADLLHAHLQRNGVDPLLRINEPFADLETGKFLRACLKTGAFPESHAALFLADRMVGLPLKVMPVLEAGGSVVCSRSFLSTLIYQQEQWPLDWLADLHEMLPVFPTHVIILDLDPEVALDRAHKREGHDEFYEVMDLQRRNRFRYLCQNQEGSHLWNLLPHTSRVRVVDGNGTPEEVHQRVLTTLFGTADGT